MLLITREQCLTSNNDTNNDDDGGQKDCESK